MSHIGKLFYCCVPQCGGLASLTRNRAATTAIAALEAARPASWNSAR